MTTAPHDYMPLKSHRNMLKATNLSAELSNTIETVYINILSYQVPKSMFGLDISSRFLI